MEVCQEEWREQRNNRGMQEEIRHATEEDITDDGDREE